MNSFLLSQLLSYSIVVAAFIGLVRYSNILLSYRPFVFICVLALINELVTTIALTAFGSHNNAVNLNLYILAEAILYCRLFRVWNGFTSKRNYVFTLSLLCVTWIVDNFILNSFLSINSLYRVIYSFTLIFLAINQLNKLLLEKRDLLARDPKFLICAGIVIYYSYKATIETFYLFQINFSNAFYIRVHFVLEIVNAIVNLIFALAILWIPRRQKFILPF